YGNSGTRKYIPSLHKIHAIPFLENDLEELNTRWVKKTIKRFDLYTRYVIDHCKSPWAHQDHIRRQHKKIDNPDEVHSDVKIVEVLRVQFDQDYKYLHKNDIEDMYLMCINRKIKDYKQILFFEVIDSLHQKLCLLGKSSWLSAEHGKL
ncbi:hypothetical protein Tco_1198163, partial [Tanacetum coccineum]